LRDNFFLDRSIHKNVQVYPTINGLSGNDGQILKLENLQTIMQNKHKYAFREINEETIINFQSALQNENWEEVYNQKNVNRKFNIFLNISLLNFENNFPLVYNKREDVTNNWITMGIRISCNHKRTLYI
jgi:hypothetical protein